MSTLSADNYTGQSATNTLKVAGTTFVGADSDGVLTITGEGGSTKTNLQQGLCKSWVNLDGSATFDGSDTEIRDSFNVGSTIDNGSGNYDATFTNNMSDANYSVTGALAYNIPISSNRGDWHQAVAESSSQINLNNFRNGSGQSDAVHMYGQVFGDLA
tara:strand:- start:565 stop:1038 length:474 start_codon:yes stop_codon:yes gene_type:complete